MFNTNLINNKANKTTAAKADGVVAIIKKAAIKPSAGVFC